MNLYTRLNLTSFSGLNNKNNISNSSSNTCLSTSKEYLKLIPPLSEVEFNSLKQSIKDEGLHIPVIVNKQGVVLDGHHRFRACKELRIPLQFHTKEFKDSLEEKGFVIEVNLRRRQLNGFQRVELGYSLEDIEKERARRRMSFGGHIVGLANKKEDDDNNNELEQRGASIDASLEPSEEKGKVSKIIAKKIGVSTATYERGKKIIGKGTEDQRNSLRRDTVGITRVYNQIRRHEQKEDLIREVQEAAASGSQYNKENASRVKLIHGDFQNIDTATIGDNSIDLIFTDPPNHKEWLPMYEPLGKLASRVLKQGGSLVMYAGNYALPQIFEYMKNSGLKYWWEMVVKHNGRSRLLQYHRVYVMWKPLLWFVKGNRLRTLDSIADLIESEPPAKALHKWEQSPVEAEHVISKLTIRDDIVFDPFMGTGTTGITALRQNRRFIGVEKEQGTFELAKGRIDLELSNVGSS
ncbi:MAG: ParB N-terminal domain-containing protein [Thermoproteota archaeon]|nr:ParB N-terminal domain-containing protein [Thermoproteota archaeon]